MPRPAEAWGGGGPAREFRARGSGGAAGGWGGGAADDAAVVFRRAGVDRNRVALGGVADVLHALVEQHFEDRAAVIGRAADQEIVGGLAPIFLQPFDVGFKATGRRHQRRCADFARAANRLLQLRGQESAILRLGGGS